MWNDKTTRFVFFISLILLSVYSKPQYEEEEKPNETTKTIKKLTPYLPLTKSPHSHSTQPPLPSPLPPIAETLIPSKPKLVLFVPPPAIVPSLLPLKTKETKKFLKLECILPVETESLLNPTGEKSEPSAKVAPEKPTKTQKSVAPSVKPVEAPIVKAPKPVNKFLPPTLTKEATSKTSTVLENIQPYCPDDILFVLDSTGSFQHIYETQRAYIEELASHLDISPEHQHAGLILYTSKHRQVVVVGLKEARNQTKAEFLEVVKGVPFIGGVTATGAALNATLNELKERRADKKTLIVVLTDGYSFDDTRPGAAALQALPNCQVIVAGVPEHTVREVLEEIAGAPSRVLIGVENKANVLKILSC